MGDLNKNSNLEIPSRWRRLFAYLLDLIINITGIGLIVNVVIMFIKRTTLGNMLVGIKAINEDNNKTGLGKLFLRYFVFYSTLFILVFLIHVIFSVYLRGYEIYCYLGIDDLLCDIHSILFRLLEITFAVILINMIELFFKCPTFIDKRLGIKRLYKKSN